MLTDDLRASLAAVKGPPPVVLEREQLPTDEALELVHAQLTVLCARKPLSITCQMSHARTAVRMKKYWRNRR